jgi:YebC/PmpR family DNA-binding regulatory protein
MAGHSKFKNIMHRKGRQDALRAKRFTKVVREIEAAARSGTNPDSNSRLRTAILAAKALNLPKDRIDNAIKKAEGGKGVNYDEIRYEGYGPGGIAIIIDGLTDNRNRTAGEVRSAFTKAGGSLGETNSVSFMFNRIGYLEYSLEIGNAEKVLEAALEAGASNCETNEACHIIECSFEDLWTVKESLIKLLHADPEEARFLWKPLNVVKINDLEKAKKVIKLIEVLENNDDVQYVSANYEIDPSIEDALKDD